jgi:hypothetical protein
MTIAPPDMWGGAIHNEVLHYCQCITASGLSPEASVPESSVRLLLVSREDANADSMPPGQRSQ